MTQAHGNVPLRGTQTPALSMSVRVDAGTHQTDGCLPQWGREEPRAPPHHPRGTTGTSFHPCTFTSALPSVGLRNHRNNRVRMQTDCAGVLRKGALPTGLPAGVSSRERGLLLHPCPCSDHPSPTEETLSRPDTTNRNHSSTQPSRGKRKRVTAVKPQQPNTGFPLVNTYVTDRMAKPTLRRRKTC